MSSRARFPPFFQTAAALIAGTALGSLLGWLAKFSPAAQAGTRICELAGFLGAAWLKTLAVPLVLSGGVLGGVGLEAMRGMGNLVARTLAWIVGAVLLALGVGVAMALWAEPKLLTSLRLSDAGGMIGWTSSQAWEWGWLGLVVVSLVFGFYRNQIEEGQGKLIMRFCQALDGMMLPLLRGTRTAAPLLILFLAASNAADEFAYSHSFSGNEWASLAFLSQRRCLFLWSSFGVYALVLAGVVWLVARVNIWRVVGPLFPSFCLAAVVGMDLQTTLPTTLHAVRRQIGVSNRVASVVIPLHAVLQRAGAVVGWVFVVLCWRNTAADAPAASSFVSIALTMLFLGCGSFALAAPAGLYSAIVLSDAGGGEPSFPFLAAWIALCLGNVVTLFSYACTVIVLARSEGEFWVPGPPPDPEELQGLKNDLALADS